MISFNVDALIIFPGRFSLALELTPHLQSQRKAPRGRGWILERFLLVTVTWLLPGIGFYEGRMRTSLDTQFLRLTGQGYRTVELYNGPARIIKRNARPPLGLSYTIMGYTTISFRRLSNFKMKLTSWVVLGIRELCVFMEVNKRETSFIYFWISWLG